MLGIFFPEKRKGEKKSFMREKGKEDNTVVEGREVAEFFFFSFPVHITRHFGRGSSWSRLNAGDFCS